MKLESDPSACWSWFTFELSLSPSSSRCSCRRPERDHRRHLFQVFGLLEIVAAVSTTISFRAEQRLGRPSSDYSGIWLDHWAISVLLPKLVSASHAEDHFGRMESSDLNQLRWSDVHLDAGSLHRCRPHRQSLRQLPLLRRYSTSCISRGRSSDSIPATVQIFVVAGSAESSWPLYSRICW